MEKDIHHAITASEQPVTDFDKIFEPYEQAEQELSLLEVNLLNLEKEIATLEKQKEVNAWKNFALLADLQTNDDIQKFDTLRSLNEALEECNFMNLSQNTKDFFNAQFGINLTAKMKEMQENPKNMKKALLKLLTLEDSKYLSFIEDQVTLAHT